jgi:hypothetical protein
MFSRVLVLALGCLPALSFLAPPLPLGARRVGVIPAGTLSHFCIVTSWQNFNQTLQTWASFLGTTAPAPGIAGGPDSNGTYMGKPLLGTTKIAFLDLNNDTRVEFLAGEPSQPSWWRDVYLEKGFEVHHSGYVLPAGTQILDTVQAFELAGLGQAVQWGRWGQIDKPGAGCYVYMDSQKTLGVTTEILANGQWCDSLPAQPAA